MQVRRCGFFRECGFHSCAQRNSTSGGNLKPCPVRCYIIGRLFFYCYLTLVSSFHVSILSQGRGKWRERDARLLHNTVEQRQKHISEIFFEYKSMIFVHTYIDTLYLCLIQSPGARSIRSHISCTFWIDVQYGSAHIHDPALLQLHTGLQRAKHSQTYRIS